MNGLIVTFKKELLSYCVSPISWIIAVVFYLWRGFELYGLAWQWSYTRADQDLFATYSYVTGISNHEIGLGAAISLFLFPILVAIVIFLLRLVRRDTSYEL